MLDGFLQYECRVETAISRAESTLQGIDGGDRRKKPQDKLFKDFANIGERGNTPVIRWDGQILIVTLGDGNNVTFKEGSGDVARG